MKIQVRAGFAVALALAASIILPVQAQESSTTIDITPLKIEGLVVGNKHQIDQEFSQKFGVAVPVPFSFIAPRSGEQKIYVKEAPGGDAMIKLFFTTQQDQVQSHIQFVPFTADLMEVEARLSGLQQMVKTAFLSSVQNNDSAKVNLFRRTDIGTYPAIEMIGNYPDPADGVIVRRIVAIPHPSSENGLIVIINALSKNLAMQQAEDVLNTSASRALGTFRFLE